MGMPNLILLFFFLDYFCMLEKCFVEIVNKKNPCGFFSAILEATSQATFHQISIKVSCHENFLFTKEMSLFVQTKMTEGS